MFFFNVNFKASTSNASEPEILKNEDLSKFMNSVMIWYFINNLPSAYLKNLASENGTVFEKLKNCLIVSKFSIQRF
jgi:hypothetical protein